MSNSLGFKQDAGLTMAVAVFTAAQSPDGSAAPVDRVVYLGSPLAGKRFQATSNPGIDSITVAMVDAATGLQLPASIVKLALSEAGLATAIAGAPLAIAAEILSGSANAVHVWVRIDADAAASGIYENLALVTNETVEVTA